jgi:signal transduction histidine kinase
MYKHILTRECFIEQMEAASQDPRMLLLTFRIRDLAQIAWKEGHAHARAVERRTTEAFAKTAGTLLREHDQMIHDGESEWYAIALCTQGRTGRTARPLDARNINARIRLELERVTGQTIETGWTPCESRPTLAQLDEMFTEALRKGAREQERFAFFSLIGHELRTPLTSVGGYLETLLDAELDAKARMRFTEIAYQECRRMTRLVENLFDISLLDLRGQTTQGEHSASLRSALAAAEIATQTIRAKYKVALGIDCDVDVRLAISEDALVHIFINLIENAGKHGKLGGRIQIIVNTENPETAQIDVADDGPGIPEAQRESVFGIGQRGQTTAQGSGIGLGLVRLFVERAGGEVAICASPLPGANIRVHLPYATETRQPIYETAAK